MSEAWHMNKGVNVGTIFSIVILIMVNIYQFGVVTSEIRAGLEATNYKVDLLTQNRIHKDTVDQMFLNRDERIEELKERLTRIENSVTDTNRLLSEIVTKLDKE
jgi:hypothetical protein